MRIFVVLLAASLALTACGRRGALEPPPGAGAMDQQPGAATSANKAGPEEKSDQPFILDALL